MKNKKLKEMFAKQIKRKQCKYSDSEKLDLLLYLFVVTSILFLITAILAMGCIVIKFT